MRLFRRSSEGDPGRWAVVGLGNPGERYERTRHNAGAMVLAALLKRTGSRLKSHKSGCLLAEARLAGEPAVLARATSYMNDSGRSLAAMLRWYKLPLERLIVAHDELDVPFGEVRVKAGGGTAGHKGLESLVSHLHGKGFVRIRVGVSRPRGDSVDYVLSEFSAAERKELPSVLERAADAVERVIEVGVERAMNEFNSRAG